MIFGIRHLRTQDGREVDLLVETQHGYYAFEIKMADRVSPIDARHINGIEEILDKPLLHSFILSNDTDTHHFAPNITAVNIAMFLGYPPIYKQKSHPTRYAYFINNIYI